MSSLGRSWVLGVLAAVSCGDCYSLQLRAPTKPLAVGATAELRYQYGLAYDCRPDRVTNCEGGAYGANAIASLTSVTVDDPTVLSATITGKDTFRVVGLASGTAQVTVTGVDASNATHSQTHPIRVLTAEVADLSYLCHAGAPPEVYAFPVGGEISLSLAILAGTTELHTEGLTILVDPGALIPVPDGGLAHFWAPDASVRTTVRTSLLTPDALEVQVYEPSQVDGFALLATTPLPHQVNKTVAVDIRLRTGALDLCVEALPAVSRTVTVLSPETCILYAGNDSSSQRIGPTQTFAAKQPFFVRGVMQGTCQLDVEVEGLGTQPLELTFTQ